MTQAPNNTFNSAAEHSAHFINTNGQLISFEGAQKPAQAAHNFTDMLQDIAQTAPKFIRHIIALNQSVLGTKKTQDILQQSIIADSQSEALKAQIAAYDLNEITAYLCYSYSDKITHLTQNYATAEQILDQWTALHKNTAKIYDFPAFQDYYLKHPLNVSGAPLEKDHGNDDRFALETPLFRACLKSPYSSYSKLFSDYKSPQTPDAPFKKELLTDMQRARIVCPDQQVYDFIKNASHHNPNSAIHQNSDQNLGATLEDNRIIAPKKMTGHRVFFQKFALPTDDTQRGSLVELQILPQSIMDANDVTHVLMDKADDLLNVPRPTLTARFHANFLYNICSYIHRNCAENGGFQNAANEGLVPRETVLNMMLSDQRPETLSAALTVQNTAQTILNATKNGINCEELNETLLEQIEFAANKAVKNWTQAESSIHALAEQIDQRIELIIGNKTKVSPKSCREASILKEVQGLIYDQAIDTNIYPNLKHTHANTQRTTELNSLFIAHPELTDSIVQLVDVTEQQTMNAILGHKPNASPIIYHCLGLVNQELMNQSPDKKALSQALNRSATHSGTQPYTQSRDDTEQNQNILSRKRNIEYYRNSHSGKDTKNENYIGVQRDIFGNINVAVEFKNGHIKRLDMPKLKNKFSHSFVPVTAPSYDMPESIRKDIAKRIVKFSPDFETSSNSRGSQASPLSPPPHLS